jgi:hypothetical protein
MDQEPDSVARDGSRLADDGKIDEQICIQIRQSLVRGKAS